MAFAYLELATDASSTATVTSLAIQILPFVQDCPNLTGAANSLTAYTGCRCVDRAYPVLSVVANATADFTSAQCGASCSANNFLCFGRGRSEGVTFCSATDLTLSHTNENISSCSQLSLNTIVNSDFDWNSTYNATVTGPASVVTGLLQLGNSASWRYA
jgi:hypothetical protein